MDSCDRAKVYKEMTEDTSFFSNKTHPLVIRELK